MKEEVRHYEQASIDITESTLQPPVVTYVGPGNAWRLEEPYPFHDGPTLITVPDGFLFDLASIPRIFWSLIAPFELSITAPLLHDFLYHFRGNPPAGSVTPSRRYSRVDADRLFRRVMEIEGVPGWRRTLAYLAVRAFGWLGWRRP